MNLIYADNGLVMQLERIWSPSVRYHLFYNNYTPTRATVLADLSEPGWASYASVLVDDTDIIASGVAANVGYVQAAPVIFTNTSGISVDCYGYYVTDSGNTKLLAAARFDSAPVSKANGESFVVIPVWGDFSQNS